MGMVWTEAQRDAIESPVGSILVAAAAGSGKTQVLTSRIIERIKGGVDADRLLVVTFTRAAAAEMRARIGKALSEAVESAPSRELRRNLALLPGASICTIDSFCLDVLRQNFFQIDLSPDFTLGDAADLRLMCDGALDEVMEARYEAGERAFLRLASEYGSAKSDDALRKMILALYDKSRSFPSPEKWLDSLAEGYDNDSAERFLEREARLKISRGSAFLRKALEYAGDLTGYAERFTAEAADFETFLECGSYEELRSAVNDYAFTRLPAVRGADERKETAKALRSAAKDALSDAAKLLAVPHEHSVRFVAQTLECVEELALCAKLLDKSFSAKKRERNVLDFSDCAHAALRILGGENGEPTDAAKALRDKYEEIYIDEYQDTNALQEAIFALIAREKPNMFMVGDVKQSIYSFRQSDLTIFSDKLARCGAEEEGRVIYLSKNFRSRSGIIDAINAVFNKVMTADTGIDYKAAHALEFGAEFYPPEEDAPLCSVLRLADSERSGADELSDIESQAALIARQIRAMVDEGFKVFDGQSNLTRECRYSDFAVLGRSVSREAMAFKSIFAYAGVPVFMDVGGGESGGCEVSLLMALLSVIDNPRQDVPLASLLRSPIFGFDENDLLKIRLVNTEASFSDAFFESTDARVISAREKIESWRVLSHVLKLDELIWRLLDETEYYAFVSVFPDAAVRRANLRNLADAAAAYEKNARRSLFGFTNYIEARREKNDLSPREISEQMNVVRYMSIHKAKGLEFPIVFLFGASKPFRHNNTEQILLHTRAGAAIDYVDFARRVKFPTARTAALRELLRQETAAEEMRLFYVALTRAKERLFVVCMQRGAEKKAYLRNMELTGSDVLGASSFSDWLSMGAEASPYWLTKNVERPAPYEHTPHTERFMQPLQPSEGILQKMTYTYPHSALRSLPSKTSVSELKKAEDAFNLYDSEIRTIKPRFLSGEKASLSGSERGTAYHRFFSAIDFNDFDIKTQKERLVRKGLLTQQESDCIDCADIVKFLTSPVGERLRRASVVRREESFNIAVGANEIYDVPETVPVYVQGTIDCFFADERGIVLLDYKTDRYDDKNEIAAKYALQLELYEKAIRKKFSGAFIEKCLYMLDKHDIMYL